MGTSYPRLYIVGPMTGIADFNYPAFDAAATVLRTIGHPILNPAEAFHKDVSLEYRDYMRSAIHLVLQAEGVVLLEGWENSKGATMEVLLAQRLGLPIYLYSEVPDPVFGRTIPLSLPPLTVGLG